jgi:hypothetical protein
MSNGENQSAAPQATPRKKRVFTRFRAASWAVGIALATIFGMFLWRLWSPGEVPDLGDPFDVELARKPVVIADGDNAYAAYAQARIDLSKLPDNVGDAAWKADEGGVRWSKAKAEVRAFHEQNRPALELWRQGSERPDALYHQPADFRFGTLLGLMQEVYIHNAFAALEGSRLEEEGKMEEAWKWYRAMLRASRMVGRHGGLVERRYGAMMHELAAKRILRWAADERVDGKMLRQALDDVLAADRLTAPISDALKLEYLATIRDLRELDTFSRQIPLPGGNGGLLDRYLPGPARHGLQEFRFKATNDVERSRRVVRFLFANWLAQVDKPAAERAHKQKYDYLIMYNFDRTFPGAARDVSVQTVSRAIDDTLLARWMFRWEEHDRNAEEPALAAWEGGGFLARERRRRSVLLVKLAAELYRREKGELPKTAGALLKGYLKELPEGIGSDDAIPARDE